MRKGLKAFLLLTVINVVLFLFKDRFEFIKHSTSAELYAPCGEECRAKWDDFLKPYAPSELLQAAQLLQPVLAGQQTSLDKIKAISAHLSRQFGKQAGVTTDSLSRLTPLQQYTALRGDTSQKLWCGTYAQMLNFFSWSQNIVCRNVELMKPADRHVMNEVYLPEQRRWVLTDATTGIVLARNRQTLLNLQEFIAGIEKGEAIEVLLPDGLWYPVQGGFLEGAIRSYYSAQYPAYYYHVTHSDVIYTATEKLKRYVWPTYWYEIFSLQQKNNTAFYVRLAAFWLWALLGVGLIFINIRK